MSRRRKPQPPSPEMSPVSLFESLTNPRSWPFIIGYAVTLWFLYSGDDDRAVLLSTLFAVCNLALIVSDYKILRQAKSLGLEEGHRTFISAMFIFIAAIINAVVGLERRLLIMILSSSLIALIAVKAQHYVLSRLLNR